MGLKGKPLKVTGKVKAITDGQFVVTGPMATGTTARMNGERVIGPQRFDGLRSLEMVLGVDFQKAGRQPLARDLRQVRGAQPDARDRVHDGQPAVVLPPTSLSQTPFGTEIQASFWASVFDVPAHEDFAVWQSFLPALATP